MKRSKLITEELCSGKCDSHRARRVRSSAPAEDTNPSVRVSYWALNQQLYGIQFIDRARTHTPPLASTPTFSPEFLWCDFFSLSGRFRRALRPGRACCARERIFWFLWFGAHHEFAPPPPTHNAPWHLFIYLWWIWEKHTPPRWVSRPPAVISFRFLIRTKFFSSSMSVWSKANLIQKHL